MAPRSGPGDGPGAVSRGVRYPLLFKAPVTRPDCSNHRRSSRRPSHSAVRGTPAAGPITHAVAGPGQPYPLRLDEECRADLLIVRGRRMASRIVADGHFRGRMWTYLTDMPSRPRDDRGRDHGAERLAEASCYLLCQTEELRGILETWIPQAGKCVLYPPLVPVATFGLHPQDHVSDPVQLVYTGKFAPAWNTLEMTGLPTALSGAWRCRRAAHGRRQDPRRPGRPGLPRRMGRRCGPPRRGLARRRAPTGGDAVAAGCDIGLGWRVPTWTRAWSCRRRCSSTGRGSAGGAQPHPAHEALLGVGLPAVRRRRPATWSRSRLTPAPKIRDDSGTAAERCRTQPSSSRWRARPSGCASSSTGPSRRARQPARSAATAACLVAGHDFKFFTRLLDHCQALPSSRSGLTGGRACPSTTRSASQELLDWADVVICEWCGPNAVWYSQQSGPDSRLLVRLHRFELYRPWPAEARHRRGRPGGVRSAALRPADAGAHRLAGGQDRQVPNWVDVHQLDRPSWRVRGSTLA